MKEAGIKSDFINGLRVTDKKSINIVEEVLNNFNKEITEALKKNKCDSLWITNNKIIFLQLNKKIRNLVLLVAPKEVNLSILNR